jgi:hypothetical protein
MKDVAGWFFTILSTFIGAFFAFRLQEVKDRAKEHDRQINEVNKALLALASQYNELSNYQKMYWRCTLISLIACLVCRPSRWVSG